MKIDKKKVSAIIAAAALVSSFGLFIFGVIGYPYFLITAIATGVFAYKVMPRMN